MDQDLSTAPNGLYHQSFLRNRPVNIRVMVSSTDLWAVFKNHNDLFNGNASSVVFSGSLVLVSKM